MLPDFQTLDAFLMAKTGATQMIQWENHILYKVKDKMFCIVGLTEDDRVYDGLSMKIDPEEFDDLVQMEGIRKMPHSVGKMWISIGTSARMPWPELQRRLNRSYDLVVAKLTKKAQAELATQVIK